LSHQTTIADVPPREDTKHPIRCGLYVEDTYFPRLVAFGKMFEWITMLHSVPFPAHLVKIMVDKVCDGSAIVSMPTNE
ncbi:unnamed protein product, partial [Sphenostylis stenocarpa]